MDTWGERFVEVHEFIRFCRRLNVETDRSELEHYERIGAMLPVARVVCPIDYVVQKTKNRWKGILGRDGIDQWPNLVRLQDNVGIFPADYYRLTDKELIHSFDREMDTKRNPHLIRPTKAGFRPWSDYTVAINDSRGNVINQPTVEHYYSYWQVHQLFHIQQYPDLYKNVQLIERIPKEDPMRRYRPSAPANERLVDYDGMKYSFDALSYWATLYARERGRTFARIAEIDGVRKLDDVQAATHKTKLVTLAGDVTDRFQLNRETLYNFLRRLIRLTEDYEDKERYKLAELLKRDLLAWETLLLLTTGETRDDVAEELGKTNIHNKRMFRHLDIAARERDYAFNILNRIAQDCCDDLRQLGDSQWSFTEADINELIDYCEREGFGLFQTALSGMVAMDQEEYRLKFRKVVRYTNLKNILTCYEYLLKSVSQGSGLTIGNETLTPLIRKVTVQENWNNLFHMREKQKMHQGTNTQQFLTNLNKLMGDSQLNGSTDGYWARQFLITCLARNLTVHLFPNEDRYYGNLFRQMLLAVVGATFYTWRLARARAWI